MLSNQNTKRYMLDDDEYQLLLFYEEPSEVPLNHIEDTNRLVRADLLSNGISRRNDGRLRDTATLTDYGKAVLAQEKLARRDAPWLVRVCQRFAL